MMCSLAPLIVIAVCVLNVQARDEMLIHGWVPEPSGRGTWSILWSCLSTMFICTWSALHLDIPESHSRWYLIFRKVGWMLLTATAPELILLTSAAYFFQARDLSKHLSRNGHPGWTLTKTQFAFADGFWTRTPQDDESKCSPNRLRTLIEKGDVDGPSISEEELKSRGKSDWIIKFIAVLQILWFVVQTLFRAIQHYQITALEIMTVAFVFCSVFIYVFSFNQPQDVEYPVILEISATALTTDKAASTTDTTTPATDEIKPKGNSDKSINPEEGTEPASPVRRLGKVRSGLPSQYFPGWAAETLPVTIFGLFACGFGALHCLAWTSPFPTSEERLAWRICSATTTALPALILIVFIVVGSVSETSLDTREYSILPVSLALPVLYVIGRITIIVLAFMNLRTLPTDAFQTVDWNNYIPHFAA